MANALASQWRAFWHTMTSNDRHAGPDAPYGRGPIPISQSRHALTSTANTSAMESRTDFDLEAGNGFVTSPSPHSAPPSQRNSLSRQGSTIADGKMADVGTGEIQMQAFSDGLPPPPPVQHSWKRIDRWLEENYEELFENLGMGATVNDVNMLEHELDCTLPQEVRESLQIHDGQERGGQPTGVIFGCMLLDIEEIIQEWQQWRTVNEAYLTEQRSYEIPQAPLKAFAGSSSSAVPIAQASQSGNPQWRNELLEKQDSQPANAVQKVYAHPAWIPLARDWGGNNIAIDLAPGPAGRWGQVILMGRDYDCKYVVSRSWSAFLATLADDMHTDKWFIDEETKELKLREFPKQGVEPPYIDILRWRADQKYGRRAPKKRPLRINSNVSPGTNGFSPYASPTREERGRSPHRFSNGKAPVGTSSPRGHVGSPLARVTEESSPIQSSLTQPLSINTSSDVKTGEKLISAIETPNSAKSEKGKEKLVGGIDTPLTNGDLDHRRESQPFPRSRLGSSVMSNSDEESDPLSPTSAGASNKENTIPMKVVEDEMKEVQI